MCTKTISGTQDDSTSILNTLSVKIKKKNIFGFLNSQGWPKRFHKQQSSLFR